MGKRRVCKNGVEVEATVTGISTRPTYHGPKQRRYQLDFPLGGRHAQAMSIQSFFRNRDKMIGRRVLCVANPKIRGVASIKGSHRIEWLAAFFFAPAALFAGVAADSWPW